MLTVEEEHRILEAAPLHLRVAIVLLVQTGGRTYSEGLSLRWDQVDLVHSVIHPGSSVKTTDSVQPFGMAGYIYPAIPLSGRGTLYSR
jgi:integrase